MKKSNLVNSVAQLIETLTAPLQEEIAELKAQQGANQLLPLIEREYKAVKGDASKVMALLAALASSIGVEKQSQYDDGTIALHRNIVRVFGHALDEIIEVLDCNLAAKVKTVQRPEDCSKEYLLAVIQNPPYPTNGNYFNSELYYKNNADLSLPLPESFCYVSYGQIAQSPYMLDADVLGSLLTTMSVAAAQKWPIKKLQWVLGMAADAYKGKDYQLGEIAKIITENHWYYASEEAFGNGLLTKLLRTIIDAGEEFAWKLLGFARVEKWSTLNLIYYPPKVRFEILSKRFNLDEIIHMVSVGNLTIGDSGKEIITKAEFINLITSKIVIM